MLPGICLKQDMHVHSTFSDGKNSIAENLEEATRLGITSLGCVDHVRETTTWVPRFVDVVRELSTQSTIALHACVEAKILDSSGRLDLPSDLANVDLIYAADHQFPLENHCVPAHVVRTMLKRGETTVDTVVQMLIAATGRVLDRYPNIVLAHLFSILPKMRVSEDQVPIHLLEELAQHASRAGAQVEVDERWRCPSPRVLRVFQTAGVPILASSDSHKKEDIGRYQYNRFVADQLVSI